MLTKLFNKYRYKMLRELNVEDFGYSQINVRKISVTDLIALGLYQKNSYKYYLNYEKNHKNKFKEFLSISILGEVIHYIYIENTLIYKKKFFYNTVHNKIDYLTKVFMFNLDEKVKELMSFDTQEIMTLANYFDSCNYYDDYQEIYTKYDFSITKYKKLKSVYALKSSRQATPTSKPEKYDVLLKVIGNSVYEYIEGRLRSVEDVIISTSLNYETLSIAWLMKRNTDTTRRTSSLEFNFNNKEYFYLKVQKSESDIGSNDFVIYQNIYNKDMTHYAVPEIIKYQKFFSIVMAGIVPTISMGGIFNFTVFKENLMSNVEIQKWFIKELCKNCLSSESRKSLGFSDSGYLSNDEMMLVEAMVI